MRLESLTVELRPRSNWEAMELGSALVRRHARAIWVPWLIVTGTVFVLLNLACWSLDVPWLALLLMWWLRPVFDRIPLYVVSRAMFGDEPRAGDTLRAQWSWGWRAMAGHLTWRRFSPFRAAMLPVDLLEGANAVVLRERRRVIGGGGGQAALLTFVCWHFIAALQLSLLLVPLFFVNEELMSEAMRSAWSTLFEQMPAWFQVVLNAVDWIAVSIVEPFFVGAGFGLYLNRRTQLEAWDVEIAFRRMRRRLDALAAGSLIALVCLMPLAWPSAARAQDDRAHARVPSANAAQSDEAAPDATAPAGDDTANDASSDASDEQDAGDDGSGDNGSDDNGSHASGNAAAAAGTDKGRKDNEVETYTLEEIFNDDPVVDASGFGKSVDRAANDAQMKPTQTVRQWKSRDPNEKKDKSSVKVPPFVRALSQFFGFLAENLLWILLGVLVIVLAMTARRWWPWMRGFRGERDPDPEPVEVQAIPRDEPLPPDVAAAARRLWAQGQPRRALALLYRASVEAVTARAGTHLPPGATESECLRVSRRLPEPLDREAFQRVVRVWQYAAYGHTLPEPDEFDALLAQLAQRFGWSA